jgi:hydroxymethylpyrimidine pyrophosphatase-like HAD family hydrolase
MKTKLFISDIDGTLKHSLPEDSITSQENKEWFLKYIEQLRLECLDPIFVAATGQGVDEFKEFCRKYDLQKVFPDTTPHILEDGFVCIFQGKQYLLDSEHSIYTENKENLKSIFTAFEKIKYFWHENTRRISEIEKQEYALQYHCDVHSIDSGWYVYTSPKGIKAPLFVSFPDTYLPTVFLKGSEQNIMHFIPVVLDILGEVLPILSYPSLEIKYCGNETVKIMPKELHKGMALEALVHTINSMLMSLSIPPQEEWVGFGDGINDCELAKKIVGNKGTFVAVGNAHDELKNVSSHQLPKEYTAFTGVKKYLQAVQVDKEY